MFRFYSLQMAGGCPVACLATVKQEAPGAFENSNGKLFAFSQISVEALSVYCMRGSKNKKALQFPVKPFCLMLHLYMAIPIKDMKAMPINPVIRKVIPRPFSPSGTLEYLRRSRIAARATMASNQPIPEEKPNTVASAMV